jgi:phytoene synthase
MTAPAIEIERAYGTCEEITRRAAGNFYYGIRLLSRPKRQAISAVYAFARRVDDIADGEPAPEAQLDQLARERELVASLAAGTWGASGDPVTLALGHARRHYDIPLDALEQLVDAVELDVRGARFETFDQLVEYCRGVAGSIGRLCLAVFTDGAAANGTAALADELGVAMQLTNILRDVREDSARGRTYIPQEDLERFECPDPSEPSNARVAELIRFEATRAEQWFDRGLALVEALEPRSASCVLAMTGIYRTILARILSDPLAVLDGRISLPAWQKTWVAARSLAGGLR